MHKGTCSLQDHGVAGSACRDVAIHASVRGGVHIGSLSSTLYIFCDTFDPSDPVARTHKRCGGQAWTTEIIQVVDAWGGLT